MVHLTRFATAAALALALVVVPLVADWCALSCEATHAVASADVPACHHQGTSTPHVGDRPSPCSHDHHPVVVDTATSTAVALRVDLAIAAPVASIADPIARVVAPARTPVGDMFEPPPLPLTLATILRV